MSKGKWLMSIKTDSSSDALKLRIVDTHHVSAFYGEWTASNLQDLEYHLSGLRDCIDHGIYKNIDFIFNGKEVGSWGEFEKKMFTFYDSKKKKTTRTRASTSQTKQKATAKTKSKSVVKAKTKAVAKPKAKSAAKTKAKAKTTTAKKAQGKVVKLTKKKTQTKSTKRKVATSRKKAA